MASNKRAAHGSGTIPEEDRHTEWSRLYILGSTHHHGLRYRNRPAEAAFCYRQDAKGGAGKITSAGSRGQQRHLSGAV